MVKISKYDLDRNSVNFKSLHKNKKEDRTANIKVIRDEIEEELQKKKHLTIQKKENKINFLS